MVIVLRGVLNLWFWQSHIGLDFDLDGSIRARKRHLLLRSVNPSMALI